MMFQAAPTKTMQAAVEKRTIVEREQRASHGTKKYSSNRQQRSKDASGEKRQDK